MIRGVRQGEVRAARNAPTFRAIHVGQPNAIIFRLEGGKIVEITDLTSDIDAYNTTWA